MTVANTDENSSPGEPAEFSLVRAPIKNVPGPRLVWPYNDIT